MNVTAPCKIAPTVFRSLTREGASVVIFSSDMMELIGLSDCIYIMYGGTVVGNVLGKDATEEILMRMSIGYCKEKDSERIN